MKSISLLSERMDMYMGVYTKTASAVSGPLLTDCVKMPQQFLYLMHFEGLTKNASTLSVPDALHYFWQHVWS